MSDNLAKIRKIIEEHHTIKGNMKLVGDSVSDEEALTSLKSARSDWVPGRLEILSEKRNKLLQTVNFLNEGLKNHFTKEEEFLPPILGKSLMQALLIEHQKVRGAIDEVKSLAANTNIERLSQEELMTRDSEIQQKVNSLSNLIGKHADKEDLMLEMVTRALEEKE